MVGGGEGREGAETAAVEVDEEREVVVAVIGELWEEETSGDGVESDVFGGNGRLRVGGGWNDVGSCESFDTAVGEDADEAWEFVGYVLVVWVWVGIVG